jgi:hypothetical protein
LSFATKPDYRKLQAAHQKAHLTKHLTHNQQSINLVMAPSRALLRRIISTCTRANTRPISTPTSRALSIHTIGAQQKHSHRSALRPTSIRHTALRTTQCARTYSSPAAAAPEPPDYLNEAELHIFNKIKGELEPVKLEVCMSPTVLTSCARRWERSHGLHRSRGYETDNMPYCYTAG